MIVHATQPELVSSRLFTEEHWHNEHMFYSYETRDILSMWGFRVQRHWKERYAVRLGVHPDDVIEELKLMGYKHIYTATTRNEIHYEGLENGPLRIQLSYVPANDCYVILTRKLTKKKRTPREPLNPRTYAQTEGRALYHSYQRRYPPSPTRRSTG